MANRIPSREDWDALRPRVTQWYGTKTANWIVQQLKKEGYNVTTRMLRGRLRQWDLAKKYERDPTQQQRRPRQRQSLQSTVKATVEWHAEAVVEGQLGEDASLQLPQEHNWIFQELPQPYMNLCCLAAPESGRCPNLSPTFSLMRNQHGKTTFCSSCSLITPEPSRAPNTPLEAHHLHQTLSETGRYFDRLVETGFWRHRREQPAFAVQKLAADAHMAISSQRYDAHKIWQELGDLYNPVLEVMPKLQADNLLTLHPRTLTALLRLAVDGTQIPNAMELWESRTLGVIKDMFFLASKLSLPSFHPVVLLLGNTPDKSVELLFRYLELMDVRLCSKVSHEHDGTAFIAQEQIYAARVLASLGWLTWAEFKIGRVIAGLSVHRCQYTRADCFRTLGFIQQQDCHGRHPEFIRNRLAEAEGNARHALLLFSRIGMNSSNEAMYTCLGLAQIAQKQNQPHEVEECLRKALKIWNANEAGRQRQGCTRIVRDLYKCLLEQGKNDQAELLRDEHSDHFVESKASD